jgi:hypothetical protein
MKDKLPEWFLLSEELTPLVMERIAQATRQCELSATVRPAPMLAHWFMLDSMLLANQANREGMHSNALSLTRQCIEALSIIELGICGHNEAEVTLQKWDNDSLNPGKLRAWLEQNVWPSYGKGLWIEPWATFMREFAAALQPYAHYCSKLSQWQVRIVPGSPKENPDGKHTALVEMRPRAYDPQKATRITLFHAILTYVLGRIWMANHKGDSEFQAEITRLGIALGTSKYLDGHMTNWGQQFCAMVWGKDGRTVLE